MLAPSTNAVTSQLTYDYGVNSSLMIWAHTLLNTSLFPLDKKPAWFDPIATELAATKTATQSWLVDDYPHIAAALPQTLINYANLFTSASPELKKIFNGANPEASKRALALEIITALKTEAAAQLWTVRGLRTKVLAFSKLVSDSSTRLAAASKEVKKSVGAASKDLLALQSRFAELQRMLGVTTTEAKNSMNGAAMTGASLTMTMMSFTISAGVGAAALPVFGLVGALIGIGINAAKEAAKSEEVLALIREIGDLRLKLQAEEFQIAALQTIDASLQTLADVSVNSRTNMEGIVHHWEDIVANLAMAEEMLGQSAVDVSKLETFKTLAAADEAWNVILQRASNIQESPIQIASERINLSGGAA
jgi:hypothetical protein